MRYTVAFAAAALVLVAAGGRGSRADDKDKAPAGKAKEGVNVAGPKDPRPAPDEKATAVFRLSTVYDLVRIGEETKSPEALVLAAKLIAANPTKDAGKDSKVKLIKGDEAAKGSADALDPAKLLDKAATLSDRPYVAEMIKAARTEVAAGGRGNERGPQTYHRYLNGNSRAVFQGVYLGGSLAAITVTCDDAGADLDIYVYDDRGNLIRSDERSSRNATISWTPRYTGDFRIEVVNASSRGTNYRYIHN